jgi:hypothetical protein
MSPAERMALARLEALDAELVQIRDVLAKFKNPAAAGVNRLSLDLLQVLIIAHQNPEWGGPSLRVVAKPEGTP